MKRAAVIVGVVLSIAVVVGAFIVGGGDSSDAKGDTTTTVKRNELKDATKAITNAGGTKVASEGPVKPGDDSDDDDESDDEGKPGKYEIKKASVQVSPPTLRLGKELKVEVRNFQPGELVLITITPSGGGTPVVSQTLKVEKNNHGKLELGKSKLSGLVAGTSYSVVATGLTSTGSASTNLKVVNKS